MIVFDCHIDWGGDYSCLMVAGSVLRCEECYISCSVLENSPEGEIVQPHKLLSAPVEGHCQLFSSSRLNNYAGSTI